MLAIAGDSAAGKTTVARGLASVLGRQHSVSICVDDYHRYDRRERSKLPYTPSHPACNYIEIMEQHLQLLATGQPILKPVYDHRTGQRARPELVSPRPYVVVEGLLPLHTKLSRACFDVAVYLDPPEYIRRQWKVARDTTERGYAPEQVIADLKQREPESEAFIRPQRAEADIVVRFMPDAGRDAVPGAPLSAKLLLRPTLPRPDLSTLIGQDSGRVISLRLLRDADGLPVDALRIHGHASAKDSRRIGKSIWKALDGDELAPGRFDQLGRLASGYRSEPLALVQLILLYHLLRGLR
jgi:phosphoribulokinase